MGPLGLQAHLHVPAVQDGEAGSDVPDGDRQVHHIIGELQPGGTAGDRQPFSFGELDLLRGILQ